MLFNGNHFHNCFLDKNERMFYNCEKGVSMVERTYIAIDLKSFYASVECVERGLDPLTTNLVVADVSRTEKTICLAVSPSLKAYGIPGRARLFEVVQKVSEINAIRRGMVRSHILTEKSCDALRLAKEPELELDYIAARPQMAKYMEFSSRIYQVYLRYIAPEDIHVYSIDEVFIDATPYLRTYATDGRGLAKRLIQEVLQETGITATAGVGTNLYLCKVAMDIVAKHVPPDADGVRIAQLNEQTYREQLWNHKPITDFWRVGRGYAQRLAKVGITTMGEIARCSLGKTDEFYNEDLLYRIFGVNAELLIDHAWGYEPCTIAHIKAYRPTTNSVSNGQVLTCPYSFEKARLVMREMADAMSLDLVSKGMVTSQISLSVGYDIENLKDRSLMQHAGQIVTDHYGRKVPKSAHGSVNLSRPMSSSRCIMEAVTELFDQVVNPNLLIRRLNLGANLLVRESEIDRSFEQLDLFADTQKQEQEAEALERESRRQKAMLHIRQKYGKNAILRAMSLEQGATAIERNSQIGGHRA